MAKSIKELKKENASLKSKSEKSDVTLIELADEVRHALIILFHFRQNCTKPRGFMKLRHTSHFSKTASDRLPRSFINYAQFHETTRGFGAILPSFLKPKFVFVNCNLAAKCTRPSI